MRMDWDGAAYPCTAGMVTRIERSPRDEDVAWVRWERYPGRPGGAVTICDPDTLVILPTFDPERAACSVCGLSVSPDLSGNAVRLSFDQGNDASGVSLDEASTRALRDALNRALGE